MKLTEKQLRDIVRESVYRIFNESKSRLFESFSSKIFEKLSYEHKGIKNIDTNSANSFFYVNHDMAPIHLYSDQQIAGGILRSPNGQYLDYDGQDWDVPSKKLQGAKSANTIYVNFNDGYALLIPPSQETRPTRQQQDYFSANGYRGHQNLSQSNQYSRIGQNRPVGNQNSVLRAQQDKRQAQERERQKNAWQYGK